MLHPQQAQSVGPPHHGYDMTLFMVSEKKGGWTELCPSVTLLGSVAQVLEP